jgi:hypothetical protein
MIAYADAIVHLVVRCLTKGALAVVDPLKRIHVRRPLLTQPEPRGRDAECADDEIAKADGGVVDSPIERHEGSEGRPLRDAMLARCSRAPCNSVSSLSRLDAPMAPQTP